MDKCVEPSCQNVATSYISFGMGYPQNRLFWELKK